MKRKLLLAITGVLLPFARLLVWLVDQLEDDVSKESDALAALDEAIDKIVAHQEADDENDASAIRERVERLNGLFAPAPGQPIDALTGTPAGQTSSPGPLSPTEQQELQDQIDRENAAKEEGDAPTPPKTGPDAPGAVTR